MILINAFSNAIYNIFSPVFLEVSKNSSFITGIVIGMVLAWFYHWAFGGRAINKSYKERLRDKQDDINSYKAIIHGELDKIQVDKIHEAFFKRLKQHYKKAKMLLKKRP
jgi:hypothetical protein